MSITASPDDGFEVVVGDDGSLSIPATELASHGLRPGAHLRIVPEPHHVAQRSDAAQAESYRDLPWIGSFNSGVGDLGRRAKDIVRTEFGAGH